MEPSTSLQSCFTFLILLLQVLAFEAENDLYIFFPKKPEDTFCVVECLLRIAPEDKTNILVPDEGRPWKHKLI